MKATGMLASERRRSICSVSFPLESIRQLASFDTTDVDVQVLALFETVDLAVSNPQDAVRDVQHLHVVCCGDDRDAPALL